MESYLIRTCREVDCGVRYPVSGDLEAGVVCPVCGGNTEIVLEPERARISYQTKAKSHIRVRVVLDNIRSAWNVGSMFRTADGGGIEHIHLCGFTAQPGHSKVKKTSLGAETSVEWTHHPDAVQATEQLQKQGWRIWVLEDTPDAVSLFNKEALPQHDRVVLVVGHEIVGVDPEILTLADQTVALPMKGIKRSLNVAVAFGIAVYEVRFG